MKRFQECNKIVKAWRYRWYCAVPFLWFWYSYIKPLQVYMDEEIDEKFQHTNKYVSGKNLWRLMIGKMQGHMKWYYTWDEVKLRLDEKMEETRNLKQTLQRDGLNSTKTPKKYL